MFYGTFADKGDKSDIVEGDNRLSAGWQPLEVCGKSVFSLVLY